jgi:hypothetical protein
MWMGPASSERTANEFALVLEEEMTPRSSGASMPVNAPLAGWTRLI